MADGGDDTAAAPVAAAALASPPAAAVLALHAPSPPPSLLLHPPSTPDNDSIPSLDSDVQLLIQDMVRQRVAQNWPLVRAFECRTSSEATANLPLKVGEWVVFKLFSSSEEMLVVGKVKTIGVYPQSARQADYFKSPELLDVAVYQCIPTTSYFVKWSPAASSMQRVHRNALVAVGFSMQAVEALPLSWPLALRRPSWRRRLGPAYVMNACVQAQLSPLGSIIEMDPRPAAE